ncbi:MAG: glycosyltransferase family 2 protein, partial [Bacteroidia bacterium]|nr:glycosyltransferase family 2 protein [Bacteroidia bacterium]
METKTDEKKLLNYVKSLGIPKLESYPKVSIIIVNHNGIDFLKNLANSFYENTFYPNFELIFVDNNSSDNSKEFINTAFKNPVLIENNFNELYSKANNQGAEQASGELLLFLNNDVTPLYGWLSRMVYTYFKYGKEIVGSVGSKLIYPPQHRAFPLRVQHRGISFSICSGFICPIDMGKRDDPFWNNESCDERIANTAACLMVDRNKFIEVGGFDDSYIYGYEDVDLGLKLVNRGYKNIFCKESFLYHNESSTIARNTVNELRNRRLNNIAVLKKKWGGYIKQNYWINLLDNKKDMFSFQSLHVAIIVTENNPNTGTDDYYTAAELKLSMEKIGWHVVLIPMKGGVIPNNVWVVINLADAWNPLLVISKNKAFITIAWLRNCFDKWATQPGFANYDIIISSDKKAIPLLQKHTSSPIYFLPIVTNVLESHTYDEHVKFIKSILKKRSIQKSMVIKIPSPNWNDVERCGDYHLALGLKKSFENQNIIVKLQVLSEWNDTADVDYDYVLVLRGLSKYNPKLHHVNLMWNISHFEEIKIEEYNLYDHVFVASEYYTRHLSQNIDSPVSALLQSSAELFFPPEESIKNEQLFAGKEAVEIIKQNHHTFDDKVTQIIMVLKEKVINIDNERKKKFELNVSSSQANQPQKVLKLRWWQSQHIIKHINHLVCGDYVGGFSQGLTNRVKDLYGAKLPFKKGISVGGRNGLKEMSLLKQGIVGYFDLYELNESSITSGIELAKKQNLENRLRFIHGNAFELI